MNSQCVRGESICYSFTYGLIDLGNSKRKNSFTGNKTNGSAGGVSGKSDFTPSREGIGKREEKSIRSIKFRFQKRKKRFIETPLVRSPRKKSAPERSSQGEGKISKTLFGANCIKTKEGVAEDDPPGRFLKEKGTGPDYAEKISQAMEKSIGCKLIATMGYEKRGGEKKERCLGQGKRQSPKALKRTKDSAKKVVQQRKGKGRSRVSLVRSKPRDRKGKKSQWAKKARHLPVLIQKRQTTTTRRRGNDTGKGREEKTDHICVCGRLKKTKRGDREKERLLVVVRQRGRRGIFVFKDFIPRGKKNSALARNKQNRA